MKKSNITFEGNKQLLRKTHLKALKETILNTTTTKKTTTVLYVLMDDEALLKINQDHLNHNTYTDIITFDLSESEEHLDTEIYISTDRIKDNASTFKSSLENEIVRVCMHGVLHCMGYKDKSQSEQKLMREAEDAAINLYHQNKQLLKTVSRETKK